MLRAILFDCDGVIADTEPVHFEIFRTVLEGEGIALSEKEYYQIYVGMTDKECFEEIFQRSGKSLGEDKLISLMRRKHELFTQVLPKKLVSYPATLNLIQEARGKMAMGIVSGALREEILMILRSLRLEDSFSLVVSAEDVPTGKPDPTGYRLGLERLGVHSHDAIGIEDTPAGIKAVIGAGMKCVAIANVLPSSILLQANRVYQKGQIMPLDEVAALHAAV